MATPRWWSKDDPPYTISDGRVTAAVGNWRQFPGGELLTEPRYIVRWWINGAAGGLYGFIPNTTPPTHHPAGESDYVFTLPTVLGTYQVVFQVWAGNYFHGWGDHPEDAIEWGGAHNTTEEPYVVGFTHTVAAPPPSVAPTANATRAAMLAAAKPWQDAQKGPTPLARITCAADILRLTDAQWKTASLAVREVITGATDE